MTGGIIIYFLILDLTIPAYSATFSSVSSLYDHLTTYNYSYIRPEADLNTATTVGFKFHLTNLQDLDDTAGKFSVAGFFEITWKDNNLTWNPAAYDGTTNIIIPSNRMWKPHLMIGNPYKSDLIISLEDSTIRLWSDGSAYWSPADSFEMACDSDVSYFPFDTQTCQMMVLPWQYDSSEIEVNPTKSTADITYYSANPQWDFIKSYVYNTSNPNALYVSMTFKRKPTFFMINIIFPILLLGVLNIFIFVLPAESGERVGFGVTLLLAIAVFMTIVADSLPSTSSPRLSSVGIFLCVVLTLSALMTVCNLFVLRIHHRDEKRPVTEFWKRFMNGRKICNKNNSAVDTLSLVPYDTNNGTEFQEDEKKDLHNRNVSWRNVSHFLDKCFILFFSIALFVAYFAFCMDIVLGVN